MVRDAPTDNSTRREIRHNDLASLSRLVGTGYRATGVVLDGDAKVANGTFNLSQIRPGLLVHASDARYLRTVTTRMVAQPRLNFSFVLRGGWQATLGRTPMACGGPGPRAMAFVLSEEDLWQKHSIRDGHARMVNVMMSREWLEGAGLDGSDLRASPIRTLLGQHCWQGQWQPSNRLAALAEHMLARPIHVGALQRLQMESRAIDIVVESIALLTGASPGAARDPTQHLRMRLVRERLDDGEGDIPSLAELAREAGMSTRTLQRQFVDVHGVSILDYARRRRLDLARERLERDSVTVAQAAYVAGYAHPANFATAFRRLFGVRPGQVRSRL